MRSKQSQSRLAQTQIDGTFWKANREVRSDTRNSGPKDTLLKTKNETIPCKQVYVNNQAHGISLARLLNVSNSKFGENDWTEKEVVFYSEAISETEHSLN